MPYHAIVEYSPESGYWASVRELPGCFSSGETLERLQANLREAIQLHLEDIEDSPLPEGATVKTLLQGNSNMNRGGLESAYRAACFPHRSHNSPGQVS